MIMVQWKGPGTPFVVLCDDDDAEGCSLPPGARDVYGDWRLLSFLGRPYVYSNFVVSRDGRVSFGVPGAYGGDAVSRGNGHDRWLMGLLRARADAVLIGDNTLRIESEHLWTAQFICPDDEEAFTQLRQEEGRAPTPLQVFASYDGNLPATAAVYECTDLRIVVATTAAGAERARARLGHIGSIEFLALGDKAVDLECLMDALYREFGVRTLLCEGGPTLYGSLLRAGLVDDEFLTLSPIVIGAARDGAPRPSLVEGVAFEPSDPPACRLIGVRRAGDYLFLRSRYRR